MIPYALHTLQYIKEAQTDDKDAVLARYGKAGTAASMAGLGASFLAAKNSMGHIMSDNAITADDAEQLVPDLAAKFKGTFSNTKGRGPSFDPVNNVINAGSGIDEAILAHELGHANAGNRYKKALTYALKGSNLVGKGATYSNVYQGGRMFLDKKDILKDSETKDKRMANLQTGTGLLALSKLPALAEETRANYHALSSAAKRGKLKQYAKTLAPGYGTYVAKAAVPTIGYFGLRAYNKKENPDG